MKRVILAADSIDFGPACPFKESTGISYYDNFLNPSDLEYMRTSKNRDGEVVMMSPSQYYEECASRIFSESSVKSLQQQRRSNSNLVAQYAEDMQAGDKFPLCYINYADKAQEGLHRMMAAGDVYGWDTEFPVLIVNVVDERTEELNHIWRYFCDAMHKAQDYHYHEDTWKKDTVKEIEWQLEQSTDNHYDVKIVETAPDDSFIQIVLTNFEDLMHPVPVRQPAFMSDEDDSEDGFYLDDFDTREGIDEILARLRKR